MDEWGWNKVVELCQKYKNDARVIIIVPIVSWIMLIGTMTKVWGGKEGDNPYP